jgi:hypothetical protein
MAWLDRPNFFSHCAWRQYQPNGTVPWRLPGPAYAKSFRPKNAERRRTNRDPVRVHLLRIGAPDRTRPKPRDDGSKRLPIWAVLVSPHLTRRFEIAAGWRGVTSRGSETRLNVPKRAIYAEAFMGNAFVSRIQRIPGRDCYLTATAECKLQ